MGVALGDRARGVKRTVLATIGDGSFQYSVQAIWTAAEHQLPIVFVVMRNGEYSILKSFAELEKTPGVPGLDLPHLDIASLAAGFRVPGGERRHHRKTGLRVHRRAQRGGAHSHRGTAKPQAVHLG